MEAKTKKTLAYLLFGGAVIVGGYALLGGTKVPTGPGNTQIPNGSGLQLPGGLNWQNNTGGPVWVTAAGTLVNGAGALMGDVTALMNAINNGGGPATVSDFPDSNTGTWVDNGQGSLQWQAGITGKRKKGMVHVEAHDRRFPKVSESFNYYNPLPGALM